MLFTIHTFAAKMIKSDLFEIDEDESRKLSGAIIQVTQLYDIQIMNEKQAAWLNLASVMGGIYGPRVVAASILKKKGKPQPVTVNWPGPVMETQSPNEIQ